MDVKTNATSNCENLWVCSASGVSEISQIYFKVGWKELTDRSCKLIEFLSARWNCADAVVNVATEEFGFGAVIFIEKLVLYVTVAHEKIGVAGSHFCAHSYTIDLFEIVAGEWKTV